MGTACSAHHRCLEGVSAERVTTRRNFGGHGGPYRSGDCDCGEAQNRSQTPIVIYNADGGERDPERRRITRSGDASHARANAARPAERADRVRDENAASLAGSPAPPDISYPGLRAANRMRTTETRPGEGGDGRPPERPRTAPPS